MCILLEEKLSKASTPSTFRARNIKDVDGNKNVKSDLKNKYVKYRVGNGQHGPSGDGDGAAPSIEQQRCVLLRI